MQETCKRCAGQGLNGADQATPHILVGTTSTCPDCKGTGKITVQAAEPVAAPEAPVEAPAAPVDNVVDAAPAGDATMEATQAPVEAAQG